VSRRIVQLAISETRTVALDNNGVGWELVAHGDAGARLRWQRLLELPSVENRQLPPAPKPESGEGMGGLEL
jgi:hypothetical protein